MADLFRFFPRRFLVPGEKTPLGGLPLGETAILQAEVISVDTRRMQKRRGTITDVIVHDGQQSMKIAFFNQRWLDSQLVPGLTVVFAGKVEEYRGKLTLNSPTWLNRAKDDEKWTPEDLNSPFPVYSRVKGIAQTRLWKAIKVLLDVAGPNEFEDPKQDNSSKASGSTYCSDSIGRQAINRIESIEGLIRDSLKEMEARLEDKIANLPGGTPWPPAQNLLDDESEWSEDESEEEDEDETTEDEEVEQKPKSRRRREIVPQSSD